MTKAFIFDLDGTLLDSMSVWDNVGYEYLISKGITHIPLNLNEQIKVLSLYEAAEYFVTKFHIKQTPIQICDEINEMIEYKYKFEVELKQGVFEFLQANNGNKMCIATATDKHLVEYAIKRLGIANYFKFIITSTEVGSNKQNPDIFIKASQYLGEPIENCIVFEDAIHALKAAKSAGFYTIGIYERSFQCDQNDIKRFADQYVYDLREVIL